MLMNQTKMQTSAPVGKPAMAPQAPPSMAGGPPKPAMPPGSQGPSSAPPSGAGGPPQGGGPNPQAIADLAQALTPERFKLLLQLMGASMADTFNKIQRSAGAAPGGQPPQGQGGPPPSGPQPGQPPQGMMAR